MLFYSHMLLEVIQLCMLHEFTINLSHLTWTFYCLLHKESFLLTLPLSIVVNLYLLFLPQASYTTPSYFSRERVPNWKTLIAFLLDKANTSTCALLYPSVSSGSLLHLSSHLSSHSFSLTDTSRASISILRSPLSLKTSSLDPVIPSNHCPYTSLSQLIFWSSMLYFISSPSIHFSILCNLVSGFTTLLEPLSRLPAVSYLLHLMSVSVLPLPNLPASLTLLTLLQRRFSFLLFPMWLL